MAVTEPLLRALARVRGPLLDDSCLIRAVASGRQRGRTSPWRRAEVRYVDLKAGRHLQIVTFDQTQAFTANYALGEPAHDAIDALLDHPFGAWHVETTTGTYQIRATKKGEALLTEGPAPKATSAPRAHDRVKQRLLPPQSPVLQALGITGSDGEVKPSKFAKYRQVEEFLRLLEPTLTRAFDKGTLRRPTAQEPLRVVDLGCGNAYLTFAAHEFLTSRGIPVHLVGVDAKAQSLAHNSALADRLAMDAEFIQGSISEVVVAPAPEVVLALHACDTATDDALARAVDWQAPVVLAAPCCHHDVAAQLRRAPTPSTYSLLTRDGIVRERFADTLTDALRAQLLRFCGYRVDVVEFVDSKHTPRNSLLRAVRSGAVPKPADRQAYDDLVATWRITPRLADLLR